MHLPPTADLLVVGGGVVGLTAALAWKQRHPQDRVVLIEKEPRCGLHASGRNSGVLHAGFYYGADSLKARLTREGNLRMAAYCEAHGLPLRRCGKLVVARSEAEHAGLDELLERGAKNRVPLESVTDAEARELEPRARTVGRAIYSPSTAVVDPQAVMERLEADAQSAGVHVFPSTAYAAFDGRVQTSRGAIDVGRVLNAAGLHADTVARDFGFGRRHRLVPFKGLYLKGPVQPKGLQMHVYPVPELEMPFLGVHLTVEVSGRPKIGPTAMPALWREHYRGLGRFSPWELVSVLAENGRLFVRDPSYRRMAARELRRGHRRALRKAGAELADLGPGSWVWGEPGIRAQLLDLQTGRLEMDFHLEGDGRSLHVLNAVSPAFTCAFSFADLLVDRLEG